MRLRSWSRCFGLLIGSFILFWGINSYFYLQVKVKELNRLTIDLTPGSAKNIVIRSLLRPLTLEPSACLLSAHVIGHDRLDFLRYATELPDESAFQLLFEIGQGAYRALEADRSGGRVRLRTILYNEGRETEALVLKDLKNSDLPPILDLAITRRNDLWHLAVGGTEIGTLDGGFKPGMECGLAVTKGHPILHDIEGRLTELTPGNPKTRTFRYGFGRRLFFWPALMKFACGAGSAMLLLHLLWVFMMADFTRIAPISLLWLGWFHYIPFGVIGILRSNPTKGFYALGIACVVFLKIWSAFFLGAKYPRDRKYRAARLLRPLALTSLTAIIFTWFLTPSMRYIPESDKDYIPQNSVVDFGDSLDIVDNFKDGRLDLSLVFQERSAIQFFFSELVMEGALRVKSGFIASSDPAFTSRFVVTKWDTIDHWAVNSDLVFPVGVPVTLSLQRKGESLVIFRDGKKIDSAGHMLSGQGRVQAIAVKGSVKLLSGSIERWAPVRNPYPSLRGVFRSVVFPLTALMMTVALSIAGRIRFKEILTINLAAVQPAQWMFVIILLFGSNGSPHQINPLLGAVNVLTHFLIVVAAAFFIAANNRRLRAPGLLLLLLALPFGGLTEDFLRQWTPDRIMYMEDSYYFNARPPVPPGYEWYLIQRMRYTCDYHRDGRIERRPVRVEAPDDLNRITVVGGSTVMGAELQRKERTDYSSVLEVDLNDRGIGKYEVINGGVRGYTTLLSWYWFDSVLRTLSSDVVILSSIYNNHIDFALVNQEDQFQRVVTRRPGLFSTLRFYLHEWRSVKLIRNASTHFALAHGQTPILCVAPEAFATILDRFAAAAQTDTFKLILVKEPDITLYESSRVKSEIYRLMQRYYEVIDTKAAQYNLSVVDVREIFRGYDRNLIFTDVVHLTNFGNRIMAAELADAIASLPASE